jgi:hypothetical protein
MWFIGWRGGGDLCVGRQTDSQRCNHRRSGRPNRFVETEPSSIGGSL